MPDSDPSVTFRELTEIADLVVTGELSLQETGRIVTSTATGTQRTVLSSTAKSTLSFYSGSTDEIAPALIVAERSTGPYLMVQGPASTDHAAPPTIEFHPDRLDFRVPGNLANPQLSLTSAGFAIAPGVCSTFDPDFGILTGTTAPTVGTGANALESGSYTQMGSQVIGHFTLRWSSNGTSGNGTYRIRVPKKPASTLPLNPSLGSGRIFTSTGNREWLCDIRMNTSKQAIFRMGTTAGLNVTDAVPAIWVNSSDNRITGHLSYLTTE